MFYIFSRMQCRRASRYRDQMEDVYWKNGIPMRIEVLLFPDCAHGREAALEDGGACGGDPNDPLLLELWTVRLVHRK